MAASKSRLPVLKIEVQGKQLALRIRNLFENAANMTVDSGTKTAIKFHHGLEQEFVLSTLRDNLSVDERSKVSVFAQKLVPVAL